jgi:hypothetical protein
VLGRGVEARDDEDPHAPFVTAASHARLVS